MYKGKKNKALVAIARDEWKLTAASKKTLSKGLWIRHVKGHSNHPWNDVADKLAGDGNFQRLIYCGPPGARNCQAASVTPSIRSIDSIRYIGEPAAVDSDRAAAALMAPGTVI